MITKTSIQIIQALLELAKLPVGDSETVVSIARKIKAPQTYLAKVMQSLVRQGLVVSQKGLNGGFRLAKSPSKISLYDVVSLLEDVGRWEGCLMGKAVCSDNNACSAHKTWKVVRNTYVEFLHNTSIDDLKEQ